MTSANAPVESSVTSANAPVESSVASANASAKSAKSASGPANKVADITSASGEKSKTAVIVAGENSIATAHSVENSVTAASVPGEKSASAKASTVEFTTDSTPVDGSESVTALPVISVPSLAEQPIQSPKGEKPTPALIMNMFMKYVVTIEVEDTRGGFSISSGFCFHSCGLVCASRHAFSDNPKDIKCITLYAAKGDTITEIGDAELLEPLSKSCKEGGLDLAVLRCNRKREWMPISIANTKSEIGDELYYYGCVCMYDCCNSKLTRNPQIALTRAMTRICRYHKGSRVFQKLQVNKITADLKDKYGKRVRQLAFLTDVPEGLSGGVYVNKHGQAVGTLSSRDDSHKMTYAICLCSSPATNFFEEVLDKNKIQQDVPSRMTDVDLCAVKEWDNAVKKQSRISPSDPGTGYHGRSHLKYTVVGIPNAIPTHRYLHACVFV